MCGFLVHAGDPGVFRHRDLDSLTRRGPDGRGFWTSPEIAMGQTRLAIIGLDDRGLAPLEGAGFVLAFNGEIYNFLALARELGFEADTDTRALLSGIARWGVAKMIPKLEGFWSFALYDKAAERLTLARDPMGVKPLYWTRTEGGIVAASTMGALLGRVHTTPSLNFDALNEWARYQIVLDPTATFFKSVHKLHPGVARTFDLKAGHWTDDYNAPAWWAKSGTRELDEAWTLEARQTLRESIEGAATSDTAITSTCSGGLDSSLVTRVLEPEVAYHANFTDPDCNETVWAKAAVAGSRTRLMVVNARERFDLVARLESLVEDFDELTVGSVILPLEDLFTQIARRFKVVLLGTGGDELAGGYARYAMALGRCPQESYRGAFDRLWGGTAERFEQLHCKGDPSLFTFALDEGASRGRFLDRLGPQPEYADLLNFDRRHFLPALLNIDDKIAGHVGIEGRPALLHHRFVAKLLELRPDVCQGKAPLRAIARGILPDEVVDRPDKMGFNTPVGPFVKASASRIREVLHGSRYRDLYNLRRLNFSAESKWSREIFGLVLLDCWLRRYA